MSTGPPQEHQDLRWPYASDDVWPQDENQGPPVPDPADGHGAAPAQQAWDGGAPSHDQGWMPDPGTLPGPDDDEDYEWIRYLGGGRSAQTKPSAAPAPRPARTARKKPEGPGDADPGHGQAPRGAGGRAGQADPATKQVPGSRGKRGGNRFGKAGESREAEPEPQRPEEPRRLESSRPARLGQKAREQKAREQDQREQKAREQDQREQARAQQEREQQQREQERHEQQEQQARARQAREQDQRERQQREQARREQDAREQAQGRLEAREPKQRERKQREPKQREPKQREPKQREPKQREPDRSQPRRGAAAKEPAQSAQRVRSARRSRHALSGRMLWLVAGVLVIVVGAAVVKYVAGSGVGGPAHVLVTPTTLGAYARNPALAGAMDADALRHGIVQRSSGEARNVVDAVYEDTTGPAAKAGPAIILFIGGNLVGTSPSGFITSFTGKLKGAVTVSPGLLGGDAACVPSVEGRLAECAWADNDTFGVVASPTLSEAALASELRQMLPLVERPAR